MLRLFLGGLMLRLFLGGLMLRLFLGGLMLRLFLGGLMLRFLRYLLQLCFAFPLRILYLGLSLDISIWFPGGASYLYPLFNISLSW